MAGAPVTNCGNSESLTLTVGSSIEIGETWSVTTDVGFSFGVLNLGTSVGFSRTKTTNYDRSLEVLIGPGNQVYSTSLDRSQRSLEHVLVRSNRQTGSQSQERKNESWGIRACITSFESF